MGSEMCIRDSEESIAQFLDEAAEVMTGKLPVVTDDQVKKQPEQS